MSSHNHTAFGAQRMSLPPGPRGLPLVGSAFDIGRDPLGFLTRIAREYGDITRVAFGPSSFFFFAHPEHIETILVTRNRDFPKEDAEQLKHTNDYLLFGLGLLTSGGEFWLRQRRLAQPAFHRQRIAGYAEAMARHSAELIAPWRAGQTFDIHEAMMDVTLRIVTETLFGANSAADSRTVAETLGVVMDVAADQIGQPVPIPSVIPTPANVRFRRAIRRLDGVVERLIAQRRAGGEDRGDLLSMLMQARDDDGATMTDKQLRDEAVTLFLAGHETTALALSWTFWLLSNNPEVDARLAAELQTVLGDRAPTLADLPQLTYTNLVLKESMRLFPPAWTVSTRVAAHDTTIDGYDVPAGSSVMVSQWVTHRDPRWFTDPERFIPERWADEQERNLPRFAYFPFGGGPRLCIGQSFALMEAVLILATIARRFRAEVIPGWKVTPQASITLRPREGVRVTLRER